MGQNQPPGRPRYRRDATPEAQDPLLFFRATIETAILHNMKITEGRSYKVATRGWRKFQLGDLAQVVRTLRSPTDMRTFLAGYAAFIEQETKGKVEGLRVAKANLGWCFGEGVPPSQWKAWNKATGIEHPVFGTTEMTPAELVAAGIKLAEESKRWETKADIRMER